MKKHKTWEFDKLTKNSLSTNVVEFIAPYINSIIKKDPVYHCIY